MPFKKLKQFVKSFPAVGKMNPEQQEKAMDIFNGMMRDPNMEEGMAIATALKRAQKLEEDTVHFYYLSEVEELKEDNVSVIEVLRAGKIHDRGLEITPRMLEDYVKNFQEGVYGQKIPVNLSHIRNGEAAGWFTDLYVDGNKLMGKIEWTELGQEKIEKKLFQYVSAELAGEAPHHETGEKVRNVLVGAGLVNVPAMKNQEPLTVFSENLEQYFINHNTMDKFKELAEQLLGEDVVSKEDFTKLSEAATEAKEAGADAEEVDATVAEVEAKVEAPAPEVKEAPEAPAKEDLTEKLQVKSLAEKIDKLSEENKAMKDKIMLAESKEVVRKTMCLSAADDRNIGFKTDDETVEKVAKFMTSLTEEQRPAFLELMGLVQSVDLSTFSPDSSGSTTGLASQVEAANKKAQELAEETGKPLHECLSEVYLAEGLTKLEE